MFLKWTKIFKFQNSLSKCLVSHCISKLSSKQLSNKKMIKKAHCNIIDN